LKKITNIIVFLFFISLITPTIKSVFEEDTAIESIYEIEKSEKENEKSEKENEKENEKEIELCDKILIASNYDFKALILNEFSIDFHFLEKHNTQFQEIFSPPPELI
jgi:hypothetical protein